MYYLSAVEEEEINEIVDEAIERINRPFAKRSLILKKDGSEIEPLFNIIMQEEPYKNISTAVFSLTVSDDVSTYPKGVESQRGSEAFVAALLDAANVVAELNSMNYLIMKETKRKGSGAAMTSAAAK